MGNNPMVGATVAVAVAVEEASKQVCCKKRSLSERRGSFFA